LTIWFRKKVTVQCTTAVFRHFCRITKHSLTGIGKQKCSLMKKIAIDMKTFAKRQKVLYNTKQEIYQLRRV
jgi:hypothetical protein